jgi:hypothetical protein
MRAATLNLQAPPSAVRAVRGSRPFGHMVKCARTYGGGAGAAAPATFHRHAQPHFGGMGTLLISLGRRVETLDSTATLMALIAHLGTAQKSLVRFS